MNACYKPRWGVADHFRVVGKRIVCAGFAFSFLVAGTAPVLAQHKFIIRKQICGMEDDSACGSWSQQQQDTGGSSSGGGGVQTTLAMGAVGTPLSMDVAGVGEVSGTVVQGIPVVFSLANTGGADSGAITVSISGDSGSNFTISSDGCSGVSLASGGACDISVTPRASANASYTATLVVSAPAAVALNTLLSGTASGFVDGIVLAEGDNPEIDTFDITGFKYVWEYADPTTFVITNDSIYGSTGPLDVSLINTHNFELSGSNTCADLATMGPGQTCTVSVRQKADRDGDLRGAFTVSWTLDIPPSPATIALSSSSNTVVTGMDPLASHVYNPIFHTALKTYWARGNYKTFTITNASSYNTTGKLDISLSNIYNFEFFGPDTCSGLSSLAAGASCVVSVRPKADRNMSLNGALTISYSLDIPQPGTTTALSSSGNTAVSGFEPLASHVYNPIFHKLLKNWWARGHYKTMTVTNDSAWNTTGTPEVFLPNIQNFEFSGPNTCAEIPYLAAGGNCTVSVRMKTGSNGNYMSGLAVLYSLDDQTGAATAMVAGGSVASSGMNVAGRYKNWEAEGNYRNFSITNSSGVAKVVGSIGLAPSANFEVYLPQTTCSVGLPLAAGESCIVSVRPFAAVNNAGLASTLAVTIND